MASVLHARDEELAALRERFPGWMIWYVPRTGGPTTWHAHRLPILAAESAEDLGKAMGAQEPEL